MGASVAKVSVSLRHIAWRRGRPRFMPGPGLRKLGYKGEDLKRADGAWLDLHEAEAWANKRVVEIDALKAKRAAGKRARPNARPNVFTIEAMFEALRGSMRFKQDDSAGDRRKEGKLSARTLKDYKQKELSLAAFDPELYTGPAAAVTTPIVLALHEQLWEHKGLAMANAIVTVLRLAYSHAVRGGKLTNNPCLKLRLPRPSPRVRIGSEDEIKALLKAADEDDGEWKADPEIGDAVMLALYTGQREGDVLMLNNHTLGEGPIRFVQSKRGARVAVKAIPQLVARLTAIQARKDLAKLLHVPATVVDTRTKAPFNEHTFRHRFAEVRAQAAKYCETVSTFWFADLRDTAVTRLALAGCTVIEIAAITGHSLESIYSILKHYLEINEAHADAAIEKLQDWMAKKGIER